MNKKTVVQFIGIIPSTLQEAAAMTEVWAAGHPEEVAPELDKFLAGGGIEPEQYENELSRQLRGEDGTRFAIPNDGTCSLEFLSGLEIWLEYPEETDSPVHCIVIDPHEMADYFDALPPRRLSDIPAEVVRMCLRNYIEAGENWADEEGYPAWFTLVSPREKEMVRLLQELNVIFGGSFIEFRKLAGYDTLARMSADLHIPIRTIEDWENGKEPCELYLRLLIARVKGIIRM